MRTRRSPRTLTRSSGRKLLLSIAALGAAASIAGLGTFATFTSSTSTSNTIASGTLSLTAPFSRLGTGASPIAAGDTMQRAIDLSYSGTISFGSATLTTNFFPTLLPVGNTPIFVRVEANGTVGATGAYTMTPDYKFSSTPRKRSAKH